MTSSTLNDVQKALLAMLKDFDQFCNEHQIQYSLGGGTLLGAVREGGFIPWDDDVDVMMTRPAYDSFLLAAKGGFYEKYAVQNSITEPNWRIGYAKLRLKGTVWNVRAEQDIVLKERGLYIDIFIQDQTANNKVAQNIHLLRIMFWRAILQYHWRGGMRMKQLGPLNYLVSLFAKIFSIDTAQAHHEKALIAYSGFDSKYLCDSTGMYPQRGAYPKKWQEEHRLIQFEDSMLPCPAQAEDYLSFLYGPDYMTPPPNSQRNGHDVVEAVGIAPKH